jgi:predicted CXXCH cytochrome family protein
MKPNLLGKFMLAALLLVAARAGVAGTLAGSAHDFSKINGVVPAWNLDQKVCVVCHTPHNSNTSIADAPLWNHTVTNSAFTMYSSPTLQATGLAVGGNSKLCLSCHDGTVAIDSFGGTPTTSTMISSANNIGADLKNDHPIGFTYDATLVSKNPSLRDPSTAVTIGTGTTSKVGTIASAMLFSGKMECSSCHDVHNTFTVGANGTGMVKMDSKGSSLCVACHNK